MPFNPLDSLYQEMANIKHVEFCSKKKKNGVPRSFTSFLKKKKKKNIRALTSISV